MTRIVTSHYRYKRPPRKRQAAALEVPVVLKATEPTKARKSVTPAESDATVVAPDAVALGDRVAPPSAIETIRRRKHAMLAHLLEDLTPEELQRRGDAADAIMREVKRRIRQRRP